MKKADNVLVKLWEYVSMANTYASTDEKESMICVYKKTEDFVKSLNEDQKQLFEDYYDSITMLNDICLREAFIKGLKFATDYLLETFDTNIIE